MATETAPVALGCHIFAGGFSIGVEKHFQLTAHLERSTYGVKSWKEYRPNVPAIVSKEAKWDLAPYKGKVDFVYGNPPCALWSSASAGYQLEHLFDWTRDVARVGAEVGAKATVIESVRAAVRGAPKYRALAAEYGFSLAWVFVNTRDHGQAQDRKRLFFVLLPREAGVFEPVFEPRPTPKILDAIAGARRDGDRESLDIEYRKSCYAIPGSGVFAADMAKLLPYLPQGERVNKLPMEVLTEHAPAFAKYVESGRGWPGHLMTRLRADEPAPVVYGLARYVHPTEDRVLTLRELMRLQGYPDDFHFEGDQPTGLRMLGKTVCPPAGEYIAREVAAYLRGERDVRYVDEAAFPCCTDKVNYPKARVAEDTRQMTVGDALDEVAEARAMLGLDPPTPAMVAATGPVVAAPSRSVARRLRAQRPDKVVIECEPEWSALPGPTALARVLIDRGWDDWKIVAATTAVFGARRDGPHLFTRKDLERLRERIARKAAKEAASA